MRIRLLTLLLVAMVVVVTTGVAVALRLVQSTLEPDVQREWTPALDATSELPPEPEVVVETPGFWSWALLDRTTMGVWAAADPTATSSTESMIKPWIVADALRGYGERGEAVPDEVLDLGRAAIRRSDDWAAQTLYEAGGADAVIGRLIERCELTETSIYPGWWSRTEMSAPDAVRMGLCLADGRAAGPQWTEWVLDEMRQVEGSTSADEQPYGGRWGIIDALAPATAARLAIKNGWTPIQADGQWHISCLAIAEDWILAVQARYAVGLGLDHGAGICREVARQVLVDTHGGQSRP